jgi:hypothetical protein
MADNKTIHFISPLPSKREKGVEITNISDLMKVFLSFHIFLSM